MLREGVSDYTYMVVLQRKGAQNTRLVQEVGESPEHGLVRGKVICDRWVAMK